jgi:hypothetical protein
MPIESPRPCPDELTPDQRRERITALLARAVRRRLAVMKVSNKPAVDHESTAAEDAAVLKLVAPTSHSAR